MTMNYREDHILVAASEFQPEHVAQLNQVLADAALGRPLRDPAASSAVDRDELIQIPVSGADPLAIRDTVQAHGQQGGGDLPTLILDIKSRAGTADKGTFFAAGMKSGHGVAAWLPAPADEMPPRPSWSPSADPPMIALLDSGVHPHEWLPAQGGSPFVIDAATLELDWHSPVPEDQPGKEPYPPGSHWGHGTFIAGLISQVAPGAQILSMRVMDSAGQVTDRAVHHALNWLARHAHDVPVDIVLMAFGRRREHPHDQGLDHVRKAISRVAAVPGVKIVASAGNDGSTEPVYPAAFAVDDDLSSSMVSVGSRISKSEWAPYSNHGPWVLEARNGTNTISTHPQTFHRAGYDQVNQPPITDIHEMVADPAAFAWWSGTSFAAAIYAGQLAGARPGGQGLP